MYVAQCTLLQYTIIVWTTSRPCEIMHNFQNNRELVDMRIFIIQGTGRHSSLYHYAISLIRWICDVLRLVDYLAALEDYIQLSTMLQLELATES